MEQPKPNRWRVVRGGRPGQSRRTSEPSFVRGSLVERFLLRVAAVHPPDLGRRRERILYASIGFFICVFAGYAFAAFYALFVRIGAAGTTLLGHVLCGVVAALIAIAVAMFDRAVISQVHVDYDSIEPVSEDDDSRSRQVVEILRPFATGRRRGPFIGRALVAVLVGFFAATSAEIVLFSTDIEKQRAEQLRPERKAALARARDLQRDHQASFDLDSKELERREADFRADSQRARRGQGGHCRPGTRCAEYLDSADNVKTTREKRVAPNDPASRETSNIEKAEGALDQIKLDPDAALGTEAKASPLDDTSALFGFIGHKPISLVYAVPIWLILLALDLGALLLKYTLASRTFYERSGAARLRIAWRQESERLVGEDQANRRDQRYAEEAEDEEAATDAAAAQEKERLRREATLRVAQEPDIARAAEDVSRENLLKDILRHRREPEEGAPPTGEEEEGGTSEDGANDPSNGPTVPAPEPSDGRSWGIGGRDDKSLVLELLGVAAGLALLVSLLGGVYVSGQLAQAKLPYDVLAAMPTRRILVTGVTLALLGSIPAIILAVVLGGFFLRTQEAVYRSGSGNVVTYSLRRIQADSEEADAQAMRLRRPALPKGAPPTPISGTAAALSVGAAGLATENGWDALLVGAASTSAGIVALGLLMLFLLGRVNPTSRWFRGTVIVGLISSVLFGAYAVGHVKPLKLTTATLKPIGRSSCLVGSYLGRDGSSFYLVDGKEHQLRVIPSDDVAGVSVAAARRAVGDTRILVNACPAPLTVLSR